LERQGELCGWQRVGFTQQGLFLMALGLGDRLADVYNTSGAESQGIQEVLRRRQALHQLIDPHGLGGFGVLVQSKGLSEEERRRAIEGLRTPAM
jgi:SAM-dependent MidA family methyltransferase